jgi:Tol biopolymer transport system component
MKKTILTNGIQILNEPAWSSNGWIAFTHFPDFQKSLIKDDGSQLSPLTSINLSLDPQWSENGQFLYYATGQQLTQPFDLVRFNIITHQIDTLHFLNGYEAISARQTKIKNDLVLSLGLFNNELYYVKADLNDSNLQIEPIIAANFNNLTETKSKCWSHDSQHIYLAYYATGDIYRVTVATGEIEQIRSDCFGRWLHSIAASPDGKYLVVEKVDLRFTILPDGWASSAIRMRSHVTLIDLQTGQMKDLDLE